MTEKRLTYPVLHQRRSRPVRLRLADHAHDDLGLDGRRLGAGCVGAGLGEVDAHASVIQSQFVPERYLLLVFLRK